MTDATGAGLLSGPCTTGARFTHGAGRMGPRRDLLAGRRARRIRHSDRVAPEQFGFARLVVRGPAAYVTQEILRHAGWPRHVSRRVAKISCASDLGRFIGNSSRAFPAADVRSAHG